MNCRRCGGPNGESTAHLCGYDNALSRPMTLTALQGVSPEAVELRLLSALSRAVGILRGLGHPDKVCENDLDWALRAIRASDENHAND